MTRLQVLAGNPRRTLGALAVVLAAVGLTVGSSASFTASSANPANTFASGTLHIKNAQEGTAFLSAGNMKPGDTQNGTIVIENDGTISGSFKLSQGVPAGGDAGGLGQYLSATITDCGGWNGSGTPAVCGDANDTVLYSGGLTTMAPPRALGSFAANDKHLYKFAVTLDSAAPNAVQGKSTTVDYTWDAVQN